jgi:5-methylcytosine-specific restriction protein B
MNEILPVNKESILEAAKRVDNNPTLRKGRESIEYDFVLDGNRYPPILILSEANKILGGQELLLTDFGNSTKKAFKIFDEFGFKIEKKYPALTKEVAIEIINLCNEMALGRENGSITQTTYTEKFKPFLNSFEKKFTYSPNLYLQNQLQNFYNSNLRGINDKLKFKSFGFWGRSIYNYVWSCIYYDFNPPAIPASFSPQLYILVNRYGIKFGFCYGQYITNDDKMVSAVVNNKEILSLLKKCLDKDKELRFYNKDEADVTASPEKLFDNEEKIKINSDEDIRKNWSNGSLLIKEFTKDNIPENLFEIIDTTLNNLKDFFLSILPTQPKLATANKNAISNQSFEIEKTIGDFKECGLFINDATIIRFASSLLCKPFVILTGLSGSGKTKIAQAFAMWICEDDSHYCIVPVGADWTNREPLLGFPNAIEKNTYVKPDNGVLDLIIEASKPENSLKPFFLILDEMNLSHVERYFADFLSVMESKDSKGILLHSDKERIDTIQNVIPNNIQFPKNLFIIGTVNIDETTYMFSPKVLDRSSVIEFRVTKDEMKNYLNSSTALNLGDLDGMGKDMAESFTAIANDDKLEVENSGEIIDVLLEFFNELKKSGAEFGYRSASEILRFAAIINKLKPEWKTTDILDAAIMQKLLPKVHGSRKKLAPVLETLGSLCMTEKTKGVEKMEHFLNPQEEKDFSSRIKYPMSFEKIARMYRALLHNGFTSYAEA